MFNKSTHVRTLLTFVVVIGVFAGLSVLPLSTSAATKTLTPNGLGNYDDWACDITWDPGCVLSGKGDAVREDDGDESYISSDTSKEIQSFGFRDAGIPYDSVVNSVTVEIVARREGAGNGGFSILAERGTAGADRHFGPTIMPGTTYQTYSLTLPLNPFTGQAWTVDEVNRSSTSGLYFGVARMNSSSETRVTQMSLTVDYGPNKANPNSITIVNVANPRDGTDFEFDAFGVKTFFLDDAKPDDGDKITDRMTFNNLTPGTYTFTEIIPSGWFVQDLWCEGDLDNGSTGNDLAGIVNVDLDAGEEIYCIYDNSMNAPS